MDEAPAQGWDAVDETDPFLIQEDTPNKSRDWRKYTKPILISVSLLAVALVALFTLNVRANAALRAYASLGALDGHCMLDLLATWSETEAYMAKSMQANDMDVGKVSRTFEGVSMSDWEGHFINYDQSTDVTLTFFGAHGEQYADNTWHTLKGVDGIEDLVSIFAQLEDQTGVQMLKESSFEGVTQIGIAHQTQGLAPAADASICSNVDPQDLAQGKIMVVEIAYDYLMKVGDKGEEQNWHIVVTAYDVRDPSSDTCKVKCFITQIFDTLAQ